MITATIANAIKIAIKVFSVTDVYFDALEQCKFVYILVSKHNNKYKYQMKSKFIREDRLCEGIENSQSDNTLELTGNENEFRCMLCDRNFRTNRGLIQHLKTCRRKQADNVLQHSSANDVLNEEAQVREKFYWKEVPGSIFERDTQQVYDKMVYWQKNMFMVPSGGGGKKFIKEITRLINLWTDDSPLENIALIAIHVIPALLIRKPNKNSKAKDHVAALEKRLELWENGNIIELLNEGESIQERLPTGERPNNMAKISVKFKELMQKDNVIGAVKLLTNEMSNGILPLTEKTLSQLEIKHPDNRDASADVLLNGPIKEIDHIVFDAIDKEMVLRAASITKGGSGPSGLDADGWRRILTSNSFGTASSDLRKSVADFIKKLCSKRINSENKSLEAFIHVG